jgi:arginine exporter protein ArgO
MEGGRGFAIAGGCVVVFNGRCFVVLALIGYFAYDMRDHILPYLDWLMYAVGALFVVFLAVKGIRAYRNRNKNAIQ